MMVKGKDKSENIVLVCMTKVLHSKCSKDSLTALCPPRPLTSSVSSCTLLETTRTWEWPRDGASSDNMIIYTTTQETVVKPTDVCPCRPLCAK